MLLHQRYNEAERKQMQVKNWSNYVGVVLHIHTNVTRQQLMFISISFVQFHRIFDIFRYHATKLTSQNCSNTGHPGVGIHLKNKSSLTTVELMIERIFYLAKLGNRNRDKLVEIQ